MNNLTIGRRLALGFGFVLALGLFVAGVALYNLVELRARFGEFESRMVARERLAYRGQVELGNGIHYFKNAVLRGGDYPQKFAGSMETIDRIAGEYRSLGALRSEAELALDEIAAGSQKYRTVIAQVVDMRGRGAPVTEVDKAIAGADKPIGAAFAKLLELQLLETRQAQQAFDAEVTRTLELLAAATTLMVLIGAFAAWRISRSVSQPLAQAVAISQAVAAGHLPDRIDVAGRDETAQLLLSMQRMVEMFRGFAEAQAENAREHEAGMVEHQIDAGRFPGVYGAMARSINGLVQTHIAVSRQVVEVVKRYAVGDLSVDMERLPGHQVRITEAMDGVRDSLHKVNAQIQVLVDAAANGDFQARGDTSAFQYEFRRMIEGLNRLMGVSDVGLGEVSRILEALARGDLTQRIEGEYRGAFGRLQDDANSTVARLREVIGGLQGAAAAINTATKEIAAGNADLSRRTEEQASSLEETASSMEELNATVKQNADNAQRANLLASQSNEAVVQGGAAVQRVVATMADIRESSGKIADIIGVIDGIAFQTNILALNAAVEAARAGEQGRGFAVVANEVRALAQRSAVAAREIKALIAVSVDKVAGGAVQVDEAGAAMHEVVMAFGQVAELLAGISEASREQSQGIEQVTHAVTRMDDVTQQNAALVEEAAAAAESLEVQAKGLMEIVARFRLSGSPGASPAPLDRKASSSRLRRA
ncbi:methyl-accepting chemotaxis protein [Zoogloea sp. LCSB751]|uniref:methyl-accepting chemotaxis protein n=1 Tax=Zoogloea sp. LCSB751 TaxID=1965277 RepID=UPI0009A48331|nr:methyl-accepting chemotaxis protein [Zoogloea sp. LCSB751]